jgi:hypothetical protein
MMDLVAPANRFHRCIFRDSTLRQFVGYDTIFEECEFTNVVFESLAALENRMSGIPFATIPPESLIFRSCRFEAPRFDACKFKHIAFEDCAVREPHVSQCSFVGILGDPHWWDGMLPTVARRLPFLAFRPRRSTNSLGLRIYVGWVRYTAEFRGEN